MAAMCSSAPLRGEGNGQTVDMGWTGNDGGGKLPVSWLSTAGQEPLYYNHNLTHEPEDRPTFTSRYWDLSSKSASRPVRQLRGLPADRVAARRNPDA